MRLYGSSKYKGSKIWQMPNLYLTNCAIPFDNLWSRGYLDGLSPMDLINNYSSSLNWANLHGPIIGLGFSLIDVHISFL